MTPTWTGNGEADDEEDHERVLRNAAQSEPKRLCFRVELRKSCLSSNESWIEGGANSTISEGVQSSRTIGSGNCDGTYGEGTVKEG